MWKSKSRQRQIHCTNKCGIKQNIGPGIGHRLAQAHTHIYICIGGFYGAVQLCVHFLLERERERERVSTFGWRYWKTANIFVPGQQLLLSLLASNKIDWNLFQFECNDETTKQSRAEKNRAEQSREEQSKAKQNRNMLHGAHRNDFKRSKTHFVQLSSCNLQKEQAVGGEGGVSHIEKGRQRRQKGSLSFTADSRKNVAYF